MANAIYGPSGDMRIFNDNVFDYIELSPLMTAIVDTSVFHYPTLSN